MRDALFDLGRKMRDGIGGFFAEMGKGMVRHIVRGINQVREFLGMLLQGAAAVLDAIGMGDQAGKLKSTGGDLKRDIPVAYARGGVWNADRGGVGNGRTIGAITNEAGDREAIINLDRRTPESQRAFRAAADSPNAPGGREHRRSDEGKSVRPRFPAVPASLRKNLVPRGFDVGSGEGLGPEMHTYIPEVDRFQREGAAKFGAFTNTYSNHPMGFAQPHFRERSVDFWGGYRGDPVGTDRGNQITDWAISRLGNNLNWLIWNGRMLSASGWGPDTSGFDHSGHVHVTAFADWANVGGQGGGGGGGWWSSIKDAAGNIFGSATDAIKGLFPKVPDLSGMGVLGQGIQGWLKSMYDKAKDWVIDKASSFGGGGRMSGNFSGDQKQVARTFAQNARARGIPGRLPVMTALQESGMQNLDYGDRDSLGYFQQRPSQGWGTEAQIRDPAHALGAFLDAAEPFKGQFSNTASGLGAWAQAVQRSAFPDAYTKHWDTAASLIGDPSLYRRGGVIPGPAGAPRTIAAHAGERILPGGATRSWDNVARALGRYGDRPHVRDMGSDVLAGGNREAEREQNDLLREQNDLLRQQNALLEELPEETGKKLRPRIQRIADDTVVSAAKGRRR